MNKYQIGEKLLWRGSQNAKFMVLSQYSENEYRVRGLPKGYLICQEFIVNERDLTSTAGLLMAFDEYNEDALP